MKKKSKNLERPYLGLIEDLIDNIIIVDTDFKMKTIGKSIGSKLFEDSRKINEDLFKSLPDSENRDTLKTKIKKALEKDKPEVFQFKTANFSSVLMPVSYGRQKSLFILDKDEIAYAQKIEHDLQERIKELECLYSIGSELESTKPLDKALRRIVKYLRDGFQFPEITVAEVKIDEKKYSSRKKSPKEKNKLIASVEVDNNERGYIKIFYEKDIGFLEEETKLIKEVARMISKAVEKRELQNELKKYVGKLEERVEEKTKELEKSKKRYENLFEYAPDGIVISTFEGNIVRANRAFYKMLRYPEEGNKELHYVKDNLYDDIEKDRPYIINKLKKDGHLENYEFNLRDKDGKPCPVIGSFNLIEVDGKLYDEGIFKDIRLRKELEQKLIEQNENLEKIVKNRTEDLEKQKNMQEKVNRELVSITEKLRESKNKLQTLFNAITDTVVMIDTNFNIQMSNRENIGEHGKCYEMVFNKNKKCDDCPGVKVFKEKRAVSVEKKIGEDYYLLQAYPVFTSDGEEVEAAIEFSRKITKEKNMELQLLQADKLASLGQLVSGIAHEINNPNTFIRGNILIIKEALDDILPILDKYYKENQDLKIARLKYDMFRENVPILVDDMVKGAERIKNIVDDLRKFAKRDEGLLTDEVDINHVVESCLRLAKNQIKRNANVKMDLDLNIPVIKGNNQKLEQVIVNMLINSSQAIKKERGTIAISTKYDSQKNEVIVKISDDGKGMDDHTVKQIFNPFFTTKRNKGGTGLGLSIAYGIIKEHKGRIDVNSQPRKGTTFYIYLPVPKSKKDEKKN